MTQHVLLHRQKTKELTADRLLDKEPIATLRGEPAHVQHWQSGSQMSRKQNLKAKAGISVFFLKKKAEQI